jgi:hypothetical protein
MHVDIYKDFVPVPDFSMGVPIIANLPNQTTVGWTLVMVKRRSEHDD